MAVVPQHPWPLPTASLVVGQNISSQHMRHFSEELAFLQCIPTMATATYIPTITSSNLHGYFYSQFAFPPGCQVGFIEFTMRDASLSTAWTTIAVLIDNAAVTWIGSAPSGPMEAPESLGGAPVYRYYFDATAYAGGVSTIKFGWDNEDNTVNSGSLGFLQFTVGCVPFADTDPSQGEPGLIPGSYAAGQPITEGVAGAGYGLVELQTNLDTARAYGQRRHVFQWSTNEDNAFAISTTSTTLVAMKFGATNQPEIRARARKLTSAANNYRLRIREKTTNGETGTIRVTVTPVGGSATTFDVTWTGNGSWTAQNPSTDISLPHTGTGQECDVSFEWKVTAGTARISNLLLVEHEA